MLGELLTGVEAEHGDVQSVSPVDDLGDDSSTLHRHFASGTFNEGVRHGLIMHVERKRRWGRAHNVAPNAQLFFPPTHTCISFTYSKLYERSLCCSNHSV